MLTSSSRLPRACAIDVSSSSDSFAAGEAASAGLSGQGVLGLSTKAVVGAEETTSARHPGNSGALASHRLPVVLGLAFREVAALPGGNP